MPAGLVLHFVLPFGPETSGSREDSVSKERLALKGSTPAPTDVSVSEATSLFVTDALVRDVTR